MQMELASRGFADLRGRSAYAVEVRAVGRAILQAIAEADGARPSLAELYAAGCAALSGDSLDCVAQEN